MTINDIIIILQTISNQVISENIDKYKEDLNALKVHNEIQKEIVNYALKYNWEGKKEYYVISNGSDNKRGKIDVKLIVENKIYLIEIDSRPRNKSIYKLTHNNADYKIWLHCDTYNFQQFIKYKKRNTKEMSEIICVPMISYRDELKL